MDIQANYLHFTLLFLTLAGLVIPLLARLGISPVLGYLVAGALVGPHGLGGLASRWELFRYLRMPNGEGVHSLAELGVVLLLFVIGLELPADRLWQMRRWVLGAGGLQMLLTASAIGTVAWSFGNDWQTSVVLGLGLAMSSTAVVMQLLAERNETVAPLGRAAFAVLLCQDLAVVPLLILLGVMSSEASTPFLILLGLSIGKAVLALATLFIAGHWLMRPLFRHLSRGAQSDSFMATTLLITLGVAALTGATGLSMALGAFLAGLMLSETEFRHAALVSIEPFKGLLMGLFFMSVGMSIDWKTFFAEPGWVVASVLGLFLIKSALLAGIFRLFGLPLGSAVEGGILLGQGGEFGFIVVGIAVIEGLLPKATGNFMLLVVSLSMLVTPVMARLATLLRQRMPERTAAASVPTEVPPMTGEAPVLIGGFGRVGQVLASVLQAQAVPYVAIERMSVDVAGLRARGFPVMVGDITRADLLRKLGVERAQSVVLTMDNPSAVRHAVELIHRDFPGVTLIARARDERHAHELLQAGASFVVPEALEASLQMATHVLEHLGMNPDACAALVDRTRSRQTAPPRPDKHSRKTP